MIRALHVAATFEDVRSKSDARRRVDAHIVAYWCPADWANSAPHEWRCRFEVPRGQRFTMQDFPDKDAARAAQGWK